MVIMTFSQQITDAAAKPLLWIVLLTGCASWTELHGLGSHHHEICRSLQRVMK